MAMISRYVSLLALIALTVGFGCKDKGTDVSERASDPEQVKALRKSLSSGMQSIDFSRLSQAQVGKQCVVTASTAQERPPTPPPLGAVHVLGDVTIYKVELESVDADGLTLRARRPSGSYWSVHVDKERITSILIAP